MMTSLSYWAVVALCAITAMAVLVRGSRDRLPSSTPLTELPKDLGALHGEDYPIPAEALELLGQGSFLNRIYDVDNQEPATPLSENAGVETPELPANGTRRLSRPVGLFIGYFPTQRTGQSIHSPQNCLPGAGWSFESSGTTLIEAGGGQQKTVGDYLISNGTSEDEVLYWYQSHGRTIASDYRAKFYMLTDAIRYGRTDAALVRIIVPLSGTEDRQAAHQRAVAFAERLLPLLPAYVPN